jgi:transposase
MVNSASTQLGVETMDLTDEQWQVIKAFLPVQVKRADGKGRPRLDDRQVLNGILWIMRTGAAWQDMPDRYPSPATCHRRFQAWCRTGVFEHILETLAQDLEERGALDLSECFIDGTFVPAKKGANVSAHPSAAKARKSWQLQTALAFLSPFTYRVLRRMKSPLLNGRLRVVSQRMHPRV